MSTVKTFNLQHPSSSVVNMTLAADGSVSGNLPAGGRNRIINGGFDVWQRGTSSSTNGGYCADRWQTSWNGTGAITTSQQAFTPGAAPVAGYEGTYYMRMAAPASLGTTTAYEADYKIEDVRTLAGQTATVSFWARASAAKAFAIRFDHNYGTGGTAYNVAVASGSVNITTSWARYSVTVNLPGLTGKTLGPGSNLVLVLGNGWTVVANETTDLWGVQLEAGTAATPFEVKPYAQELRDCQRYYQIANINLAGYAANASFGQTLSLPVVMRTTPTPTQTLNNADYTQVNVSATTSSYIAKPYALMAYRVGSTAGFAQYSEIVSLNAEL